MLFGYFRFPSGTYKIVLVPSKCIFHFLKDLKYDMKKQISQMNMIHLTCHITVTLLNEKINAKNLNY